MFTLPFTIRRRGYHVATDEMVDGLWKLAIRLKLTGIRHGWVLVSRTCGAS